MSAGVHAVENWPDIIAPGLFRVLTNQYGQEKAKSMIPMIFSEKTSKKNFEKDSSGGALGDFDEFTGIVGYGDTSQGYDKTYEFTEYAKGIKITRQLFDDDLYNIMNKRPKQLGTSAMRTKEKKAAAIFNDAFTSEPTDGDAAELCASDHANAGDSVAQSNEGTTAISAVSVEATRRLMIAFKGDQSDIINVDPDMLLVPTNLEETAWEIINSKGKVDTADNNQNFHYGKYKLAVWKNYLTDSNNWFMLDSNLMKDFLLFWNRIPLEFFQDKDSDTLIAKYIGYMRFGLGWSDWRFIYGHLVS